MQRIAWATLAGWVIVICTQKERSAPALVLEGLVGAGLLALSFS